MGGVSRGGGADEVEGEAPVKFGEDEVKLAMATLDANGSGTVDLEVVLAACCK